MQKYSNTVYDLNGDALASATVTVRPSTGVGTATIYSDNGITTKTNPFSTDVSGYLEFYAADGTYQVEVSLSGYTTETNVVTLESTTVRVDTVAELKAITVTGLPDNTQMQLLGYYSAGDGGGQLLYWDADSSATANDGTVFLPTGHVGNGRWLSVNTKDLYVECFGAKGDDTQDDYSYVDAALSALKLIQLSPNKTYKIATGLKFKSTNQKLSGFGPSSVLHYTGTGTAIDYDGYEYCECSNVKITSTTGAIGIDVGYNSGETRYAHFFKVKDCTIDGQSGAVPTGFTTAALQIEKAYYGEVSGNDIIYSTVGVYGFNECNGNYIIANSIRQCKTGVKLTDDTANSDGTMVIGNEIESAATGSLYAISILGADSNVITGNRLEYTVGTAHIHINSNTGTAQFNQLANNVCEGTIAGIILGDGSGSSQVVSTIISGGRASGAVTINSDCTGTVFTASPSSYGGTLTDNGSGSIVSIDPANSKHYIKNGTVKGFDLTVGGAATIIDVGSANYLDIKNPVGTHTRFETSGLLRVAQGSIAAGGDSGGTASCNTLSSVSDVTANSTGTGTIKFKGATNRDSTGFIKVYVGTTAYYVPVFSAITG